MHLSPESFAYEGMTEFMNRFYDNQSDIEQGKIGGRQYALEL